MFETRNKTTTRRALMGNAGMAALAGIAGAAIVMPDKLSGMMPSAPSPDAELIAIGREANALLEQRRPLAARWWTMSERHPDLEAVANAMEPIDERLDDLTQRARELPATTREGMGVKGRLIQHQLRLIHNDDEGAVEFVSMDPGARLAWSLAEDLLGAEVAQ